MSEISWLRARAAAMRVAMYSSDMSDAIDTVLDHLASVEVSRIDALDRVAELERENGDLANACEHMRDELKEEMQTLAWANYQLCGLVCDELGVSANAARATAASRRPDQSEEVKS